MAVTWPSGSEVCDKAKVAISAPVITKANKITRGPGAMDSANDLLSLPLNVDYHDRQDLRLSWLHLACDFRKIPRQITQLFHDQHRAGPSPFRSQTLTNQFITDLQHARFVIGRYFRFLPLSKFIFQADPPALQSLIRIAPFEIIIWQRVMKRHQRWLLALRLERRPVR